MAEPADPRREALEGDLLPGSAHPLLQAIVVGEQIHDGAVGRVDVLGVAGEGHPTERALALTEQGTDVGGHESGEVEGPAVAAQPSLVTDRVAVVEDLRAGVLELHHRLDVGRHRLARPVGELLGLLLRELRPVLD